MDSITAFDLHWAGKPRCVATALLASGANYVLVDPGPASTLPALRSHLAERGLSIRDIDAILLTHIHLDHAGVTGSLVRENPELPVYVHKAGAPHVINPTKLLASAGRLWGSDVSRLFGETLPVPLENLCILEGGESLTLGTHHIDVAYTPGHASHHVSYFEQSEGIAFVGDTAGVRIENHPYIMPATPPPDVDLALWDTSFTEILVRKPERLFLTHFGFAEHPAKHIAIFRERLHAWNKNVEEILRRIPDDAKAQAEFIAAARQEIALHVPAEEVDQYAFAAGVDLSFLGLARHIRTKSHVS
jgi:glyoxylase-like metal-dependent hydrolase (beta-lactamase superfamily II)